jgi:hypothetical protein
MARTQQQTAGAPRPHPATPSKGSQAPGHWYFVGRWRPRAGSIAPTRRTRAHIHTYIHTHTLSLCLSLPLSLALTIIAPNTRGDPARLHYGYDFNGHVCGSGINKGKENLYYPYPFPPTDPVSGDAGSYDDVDLSWSVCVEKCPNPSTNTVRRASEDATALPAYQLPKCVGRSRRACTCFWCS